MISKSRWIILVALLAAASAAPGASADEYSITFTGGTTTPVDVSEPLTFSGTTLEIGTIADVGDAWSFPTLTTTAAPTSDIYQWGISGFGMVLMDETSGSETVGVNLSGPALPADGGSASVRDLSVAAPEPGTQILTLCGLGLIGLWVVMRKRFAQRHPLST